jgi:Expansin C-terminal domain
MLLCKMLALCHPQGFDCLRLLSVHVQGSSAWTPLDNMFGAVWQSPGALPQPPYDVQITPASGPALIARCAGVAASDALASLLFRAPQAGPALYGTVSLPLIAYDLYITVHRQI